MSTTLRQSLINAALASAAKEIGVEEDAAHTNRGKRVTEYQLATGYDFPVPWCLCYCFWNVLQATQAVGQSNRLIKTGDCDTCAVWAKKNGVLFADPQPGDIGLLYKETSSGRDYHHAVLVEKVDAAAGKITTLEGNTNNDGSRDGYAVLRRSRAWKTGIMYVRWASMYPGNAIGDSASAVAPSWAILSPDGKKVADGPMQGAKVLGPVKAVLLAVGVPAASIAWDADDQLVKVAGGGAVGPVTLIGGSSWAPVREILTAAPASLGADANADTAKRIVQLVRQAHAAK